MYRKDLSPCRLAPIDPKPTGRSVGWLDRSFSFDTGATPWMFRLKLRRLSRDVKNPMWGFHECEFCRGRKAKGNGEIHVIGQDDITYVAPQLIVHYIGKHKYMPPQQFVDAVLWNGW